MRDVEIAAFDELRHLPEEEGQQQSTDVCAVNVRVSHDDDFVVAQLFDVELVAANAGTKRHDKVADLLTAKHAVETGAFDVQDLALQRQDRLCAAVTPCLG